MKREFGSKSVRNTILYSIIAVLLFVILFVLTYHDRGDREGKTAVRIVMMGDSIVGECRDETSVPEQLAGLLGEPVFNGGLGGTSMSRLDRDMRMGYTKDCLSMQAFSQSIATADFGVQQTVRSRESVTEYFENTINEMEKIDFRSVDVLFIGHGINDYHAGVPIYNEKDPYDEYTFTGAIRSTLKVLQKAYPDMRIILITPTYSWYPYINSSELTCEEYNLGGGVLEEYVNAEIQTALDMGVEVIDIYHDFYPHEQWSDWELYTRDGLHPNEAGRKLIAETLYQYLTDKHGR